MENTNLPGEPERPSLSGPDIGIPPGPESSAMPQPGVADLIQNHALSQPKIPKKRTKTGCLTCRQRRIKCGEEKPICNNCIKSKRECKGYAQRLVFKDPLLISESWSTQQTLFNPAPHAQSYAAPAFSQPRPAGSQPPVLAPRPVAFSSVRQLSSTGDSTSPVPYLAPISHSSPSSTATSPDANASVHAVNMARAWPQDPISSVNPPHIHATNLTPNTTQGAVHAYSEKINPPILQQGVSQSHVQYSHSTTRLDVPYADDDDDYYDVESDEEPEQQILAQNFNQLNLIMASANRDESLPRSFKTYLNEPNILTSYHPTLGSSPLNNPKTARIFLHFIHSTGPSLSVFERHPIDPSTMFGAPVQAAQQGLWTYTLPFKALEHQALLQAMLAVSSLHIAYLQQAPATVSLKHYHYALKRVGVAVGLPMRRAQVGTLAAALLLAYYEVMTAEHTKWNSHIAGAVNLIHEIDFAGITRDLRLYRRRTWAQRQTRSSDFFSGNTLLEDDPFAEQESSIDPGIIGSLLGQAVNYDEFGQVVDKHAKPRKVHFTRKDIECYRIQCDMYWWCCKQDIFQSIVSGSSLFMKYSRFGQCPPRAGMGRLDAIYGSADHMWLLLGRITDFGYRDRRRKLKTLKAAGMDWRPDASFFRFMARFAPRSPGKWPQPQTSPFPSPQQRAGMSQTQPSPAVSTSESPPMYGMVPSKGRGHAPPAFTGTAAHPPSPGSDSNEGDDVPYDQAEQEWESILSALDIFSDALGPHFLPLPSDSAPPIATPFGPALQYRTQTIALIWAYHYMSRILLYRLHPSMPPAMMVASGAAASTTAEYAQIVGKIASGIYYPQAFNLESGNLSPNVGSCLIETTIPIFLAAVQYTDRVQRHWVVTRLREISRLAGWRSSEAIADGCETSWKAAAKQGRGPPYEPPSDDARQQPYSQMGTTYESTHPTEKRYVRVDKPWTGWARGIMGRADDILSMEMEDR